MDEQLDKFAWPHPIRSTETDSAHELATALGWQLAED